ncbi:ABC transporter permease subunit [Neobacillus sp. PS3-34]|uniref:ABC transporter permease subunit n=1 Tax=Neobacillus sp. PS3-34 TaxID=3070678 RepID=UPI0027DEF18C|nr:ABC transporter permease subunit [Neobacillus sp. PS3-34]WML47729.1 ABC transporter permease subunit [Neobacillus sp. PS3-34]
MIRVLQQSVIIFILILFLAALPVIIGINPATQSIEWHFDMLSHIFGEFMHALSQGSLGTYTLGAETRFIADDIGDNFVSSFLIIAVGVNLGVLFSLIFGIFVSRFRFTKIFNLFLNVLATIPDFIIIILSLILAVKIYKETGFRVVSLRRDAGPINIWFPMVLVGLAPTLYLFKLVAVRYYQISGDDYIKTAVAKGMRLNYINFQHVFKNVEPFIIAELTKVISLAIGNLFIVEYLMNVPGITKFIFLSNEVQPLAIGLFSLLIISLLVYISVRLVLYLFKRGFIYE